MEITLCTTVSESPKGFQDLEATGILMSQLAGQLVIGREVVTFPQSQVDMVPNGKVHRLVSLVVALLHPRGGVFKAIVRVLTSCEFLVFLLGIVEMETLEFSL